MGAEEAMAPSRMFGLFMRNQAASMPPVQIAAHSSLPSSRTKWLPQVSMESPLGKRATRRAFVMTQLPGSLLPMRMPQPHDSPN